VTSCTTGANLRALTLIDAYTRECLAIWVDQGIRGEPVVALVSAVTSERGAPRRIQVDNGPEFVSKVLDSEQCWGVSDERRDSNVWAGR
jgi:putative transposase